MVAKRSKTRCKAEHTSSLPRRLVLILGSQPPHLFNELFLPYLILAELFFLYSPDKAPESVLSKKGVAVEGASSEASRIPRSLQNTSNVLHSGEG